MEGSTVQDAARVSRRQLLRATALLGGSAAVGALGVAQAGAAQATSTAVSAPRTLTVGSSNDVALIGDSLSWMDIQAGVSGEVLSGMATFGPRSFFGWAAPRTQGRFTFRGSWASPGWTTAMMLSMQLSPALASNAAVISVLGGTNDVLQAVDIATTQANLTSLVTGILANNQIPIMCTLPPCNVFTAAQAAQAQALNNWIRGFAAQQGVPLADFNLVLTDPTTGLYNAGMQGDGTHPSSAGAYAMGMAFANALNSLGGSAPSALLSAYSPNAMLKDVLLQGPQGSDAATWLLEGSSVGGGLTLAQNAGWAGNLGVLARGTGDLYMVGQTSTPVPGDQMVISFLLDAGIVPAGGTWSAGFADLTAAQVVCGYQQMDHIAGGTVTWRFTVPTTINTSHQYGFVLAVLGAAGTTVGCAQVSIQDTTVG